MRFDLNKKILLEKVCLVLALVIGVIVYRVSLMMAFPRKEDQTLISLMSSISAACINLGIIIILSRFYSWIAVKLTDLGKKIRISNKFLVSGEIITSFLKNRISQNRFKI